jgi:hypothetical protein
MSWFLELVGREMAMLGAMVCLVGVVGVALTWDVDDEQDGWQ